MADRVRSTALRYVSAYGECVHRDIMPAFGNLEERADKLGAEEYERLGSQPADEDWDGDMSSLAEAAEDKAIAFYETMIALRQAVLNLFAVGLFHILEQQLADLCRDGAFTVPPPQDTKISAVADWYEQHFLLDLRSLSTWPTIDELRLVANATKHAEGSAARQLRAKRPELFQNPIIRDKYPRLEDVSWPITRPLAGEDFYVTIEIMNEYNQAATTFVSDIAEYFTENGDEYYPN
jgi:hypothetical protein